MERPIESRHDRLFDFRAAEAIAGADDFAKVELGTILFA